MSAIPNLDEHCKLCPDGKPIGDHTMREWSEHIDRPDHVLDYEAVPGQLDVELDGMNLTLADHITMRATVLAADSGQMRIATPLLVFDFARGVLGTTPEPVARVGLLASVELMRKVGKLVRDAAYGAANAAEKAR